MSEFGFDREFTPDTLADLLREQDRTDWLLEHDMRVDRAREVSDERLAWPGPEAAEVAQ